MHGKQDLNSNNNKLCPKNEQLVNNKNIIDIFFSSRFVPERKFFGVFISQGQTNSAVENPHGKEARTKKGEKRSPQEREKTEKRTRNCFQATRQVCQEDSQEITKTYENEVLNGLLHFRNILLIMKSVGARFLKDRLLFFFEFHLPHGRKCTFLNLLYGSSFCISSIPSKLYKNTMFAIFKKICYYFASSEFKKQVTSNRCASSHWKFWK